MALVLQHEAVIDRLRAERDEARAVLETERARTAACFQTWKAEVIALLARIETAERELSALLAGKSEAETPPSGRLVAGPRSPESLTTLRARNANRPHVPHGDLARAIHESPPRSRSLPAHQADDLLAEWDAIEHRKGADDGE